VLKRHQEQQGAPGAVSSNSLPDPPRAEEGKDMAMGGKTGGGGDLPGAIPGSGSNVSPRGAPSGGGQLSGSGDGEQAGSSAPAKRSLISSIRHSLFGSRNGARADGASASAPSQSNNKPTR